MGLFRRREKDELDLESERVALRRQREAMGSELEGLKRTLAERVAAVQQRERELAQTQARVEKRETELEGVRARSVRVAEIRARLADTKAKRAMRDESPVAAAE